MSTQPGYGPSPPSYPPPQQSSSTIIWIIVLVLVLVIGLPILAVGVVLLGCCGLMGVGAYSAFQIPAEMVKQQYANDPVIQQHIGEIQSVSLNITATGEEQQKPGAGGAPPVSSIMVFDIRGTKGSGQIIAEQEPGNPPEEFFSKATLRTSQGEFPLSQ